MIVFAVLAGVIGWHVLKPGEPVSKGRTLTSWLGTYEIEPVMFKNSRQSFAIVGAPEANEAVRQIGPTQSPPSLRYFARTTLR